MGLDLTLVFDFAGSFGRPPLLARNTLSLNRDYSLFSQLGQGEGTPTIKPVALPPNMTVYWYDDEGLRDRATDPYGSRLTYVLAGDLARLDVSDTSNWNKAVFAMVLALDPSVPVVLWWH